MSAAGESSASGAAVGAVAAKAAATLDRNVLIKMLMGKSVDGATQERKVRNKERSTIASITSFLLTSDKATISRAEAQMQTAFKQTEVVLSQNTKTRRKVGANNEPFFDAEKTKRMKSVDSSWYLAFAQANCGGEIAHS
eukprot:5808522-Pyramimonas_sp.AAC.2